jgi:hypothetical protein
VRWKGSFSESSDTGYPHFLNDMFQINKEGVQDYFLVYGKVLVE